MKPPRYEEMDRGREDAIPIAFLRVCGNDKKFDLVRIPPPVDVHRMIGPVVRTLFEVRRVNDGELVAELYPNGHYQCYQDDFRESFEKITDMVDNAAKKSYERFMEEYERRRASN